MSKFFQQSEITLSGSSKVLTEFFGKKKIFTYFKEFGINSILFQRGIYPPSDFSYFNYYSMKMFKTTNKELHNYLQKVLTQLKIWLTNKNVQKLVLVVTDSQGIVLERWGFDIKYENQMNQNQKSNKDIMNAISAVIRQITSSVSFLPLIEGVCLFDLLVYTSKNVLIPVEWEKSPPKFVEKSEHVKLRSFTTSIHTVKTSVSYKFF